jgi:hypothetical protein
MKKLIMLSLVWLLIKHLNLMISMANFLRHDGILANMTSIGFVMIFTRVTLFLM